MEFEYKYANLIERKSQIDIAEGQGQMMLHDNFDPDWKSGDEPHGTMIFTDDIPPSPEPQPPCSIHLARLTDINPDKVKPATVIRNWEDKDYIYDCFVTQTIKDQWVAGDISIGDIVLVEFLEDAQDRAIVIHKVFKTW